MHYFIIMVLCIFDMFSSQICGYTDMEIFMFLSDLSA